MNTGFSFK